MFHYFMFRQASKRQEEIMQYILKAMNEAKEIKRQFDQNFMTSAGFEPTTFGSGIRCSTSWAN